MVFCGIIVFQWTRFKTLWTSLRDRTLQLWLAAVPYHTMEVAWKITIYNALFNYQGSWSIALLKKWPESVLSMAHHTTTYHHILHRKTPPFPFHLSFLVKILQKTTAPNLVRWATMGAPITARWCWKNEKNIAVLHQSKEGAKSTKHVNNVHIATTKRWYFETL